MRTDAFIISLARRAIAHLESEWPKLTPTQQAVARHDCRKYVQDVAQWPFVADWSTITFVGCVVCHARQYRCTPEEAMKWLRAPGV